MREYQVISCKYHSRTCDGTYMYHTECSSTVMYVAHSLHHLQHGRHQHMLLIDVAVLLQLVVVLVRLYFIMLQYTLILSIYNGIIVVVIASVSMWVAERSGATFRC
jgi:hypothetical protein